MIPRRLLPMLVLAVLVGLSLLVGLRWSTSRLVAQVSSAVTAPVAGDDTLVAWIEQKSDGYRLRAKTGLGPAKELLSGAVVSGLAVRDGRVIVTVAEAPGAAGKLRSVSTRGGAKDLATISAPARQIATSDGWICWLTGSDPALPAAPFLVAAGPASVIGVMPETGGSPTAVAALLDGRRVELIGLAGGKVYWLERQQRGGGNVTLVQRRAVEGGPTEVLVEEPGDQSAALLGDRLAWTAPSQEATSSGRYSSVKVMPLSGGDARVVADWIGIGPRVLGSGGVLYVQDRECLWRIGEGRGEQRLLYDASHGGRFPTIVAGNEYLVIGSRRGATVIKRGVTWGARLRNALRLGG